MDGCARDGKTCIADLLAPQVNLGGLALDGQELDDPGDCLHLPLAPPTHQEAVEDTAHDAGTGKWHFTLEDDK